MEMLEKRVKSRFSHRQLHVVPVAAPVLTDPSLTSAKYDETDDEEAATPFDRYCALAASLLKINNKKKFTDFVATHPHFASLPKRQLQDSMTKWNAHVDDFFEDELVTDCLRQTWEVSTCIRKLRNFIVSYFLLNDQKFARLS